MLLSPARFKAKLLAPLGRVRARAFRNRDYLRVRVRARRFWRLFLAIPAVGLIYRTIREMGADDATHMAAGVAYYTVLSLFPLVAGIITLLGMMLDSHNLESEIFRFFQDYLPGSRELLEANINAAGNIRGVLGVASFIGLFWSASLLFGAISRAVNRAWDVHNDRPFYIDKPRHIIMAVSVAPLFMMSFTTTAALQALGNVDFPLVGRIAFLDNDGINLMARPLPFVFSLAIFLLIYKFTPNTRTYWRYVWPGALLAAALFEISKSVFVFYLETFANFEELYGSLASIIVLLSWTYVSGLILIAGAEFTSEYERMRRGVERGHLAEGYPTIPPR